MSTSFDGAIDGLSPGPVRRGRGWGVGGHERGGEQDAGE
jgi:hypothetical protein